MEPIQYAEDLINSYILYIGKWDCYHDEPIPIDDVVGVKQAIKDYTINK